MDVRQSGGSPQVGPALLERDARGLHVGAEIKAVEHQLGGPRSQVVGESLLAERGPDHRIIWRGLCQSDRSE